MCGKRKHEAMWALFGEISDKCRWCSHLIQTAPSDRHYYKCELYGISCAESTDWAITKHGCGMMNKAVDMRTWVPVIDRLKHEPKPKPEPPMEGQITFEEVLENAVD